MWMCSMCLIHESDAFKDLKAQHISVIVSVGGGVKKRIPGLFVPVKARRQDVAEVLMVTMEMRAQRRRGQSDSSPLTTTSVCVFFLIRGGVSPLFPFFKHTFVCTKKCSSVKTWIRSALVRLGINAERIGGKTVVSFRASVPLGSSFVHRGETALSPNNNNNMPNGSRITEYHRAAGDVLLMER